MPFAPALKKKGKKDPYGFGSDERPKYAARNSENTAGTWTTYDPTTDSFQYDTAYKSGKVEDRAFVDDGEDVKPEDQGVSAFKSKFVNDDELLDDYRARNDFDVRNAKLRGIGINRRGLVISNEIGEDTVQVRQETDDRVSFLAPDDSWKDGITRGQPKKRHILEYKRRLEERNNEMTGIWTQYQAWLALSQEEKERRRAERRETQRKLMEDFRLSVVDTIPAEVLGVGLEMESLNIEDSASESTARTDRSFGHGRRTRDHRSRSPVHRSLSRRGSISSSTTTEPLIYLGSSDAGDSSMGGSVVGGSIAAPPSISLPYRSRAPSTVESSETSFQVSTHPGFFPPEDVSRRPVLNTAQEQQLQRVLAINNRKGRVATVRLDSKVTRAFPEAMTDRLWGGMIQDVTFHPASHHAVVVFVTATGCNAFLRHWQLTAVNSAMEFRRLQIAAEFYQGAEDQAVMPAQPNILSAILCEGATRVLIISNINKFIKKNDAEDGFRRSIGLERFICKGRLVVPAKLYEKRDVNSNSLVMEFASVRDAIEVRDAINNKGLGLDFTGCTAEFARDPADKPPVMREWCDCRWCRKARAKAGADMGMGTESSTISTPMTQT